MARIKIYGVAERLTKKMGAALKRANKPHELIMIAKGDHQLGWRSERIILLTALEKCLATNLGEIRP